MVPRYPVILASASPRRRELLRQIFADFQVFDPDLDESSDRFPLERRVAELAMQKAKSAAAQDSLVIGSDTIVALEDEALGKPRDPAEAARMLGKLSARTHEVHTGVALLWPGGSHSFCETATVEFRNLSPDEIRSYVYTGEPMDKAGAYAIQGGAADFISRVGGDTDTVIGLPVAALARAVEDRGLAHR